MPRLKTSKRLKMQKMVKQSKIALEINKKIDKVDHCNENIRILIK